MVLGGRAAKGKAQKKPYLFFLNKKIHFLSSADACRQAPSTLGCRPVRRVVKDVHLVHARSSGYAPLVWESSNFVFFVFFFLLSSLSPFAFFFTTSLLPFLRLNTTIRDGEWVEERLQPDVWERVGFWPTRLTEYCLLPVPTPYYPTRLHLTAPSRRRGYLLASPPIGYRGKE